MDSDPPTVESSTASSNVLWTNHLECWRNSGLSQAEYCRRHQLKYSVFHYWKKKLLLPMMSQESSDSSFKFIEVDRRFTSSTGVNSLTVHNQGFRLWYGDFCIEVMPDFSPVILSELLRTLQEL